MEDYLAEQVERKRAEPADDVLSALIAAEIDGVGLTPDELVAQRFITPEDGAVLKARAGDTKVR